MVFLPHVWLLLCVMPNALAFAPPSLTSRPFHHAHWASSAHRRLHLAPCGADGNRRLWSMKSNGEYNHDWDLVVLGGGPTGLTAALTAADAGLNVAIMDGTPSGLVRFSGPTGLFSKALRDSAKKVKVRTLREMGILDTAIWKQVVDLTKNIVNTSGEKNLAAVESFRITHKRATAVLLPDKDETFSVLEATDLKSGETVTTSCAKLLIATGSSPVRLPNFEYDDKLVFDSDSIRALSFLPRSMIIIGSGIIAIEYAKIFATLATDVTIVIRARSLSSPLARIGIDDEISTALEDDLAASGVRVITEAEVEEIEKPEEEGGEMTVHLKRSKSGERIETIWSQIIMTATGRRPNTRGLGLEEAGVALSARGEIEVDGDLKTSVPGVYAAGDCVGPPALASTGIEQARAAVRRMFDQDEAAASTWMQDSWTSRAAKDPKSLLACPLTYPVGIWTIPETSFIGYTAESARMAGFDKVGEGRAMFANTIRGRVQGIEQGMLKLVFSKPDGRILGVHIFGEDACELIHYGTALAQSEKTVREVLGVTFTAVTFHELFAQAAQDAIAKLDADSWRQILTVIGTPTSRKALEVGLVDAGMNQLQAQQFVEDCKAHSVTLQDAMKVARRFRIPSKYKLMEALTRSLVGPKRELRERAENLYGELERDEAGEVGAAAVVAALVAKGVELRTSDVEEMMRAVCQGSQLCVDSFASLYEKLLVADETGFKLRARRMFDEIDADGSGLVDIVVTQPHQPVFVISLQCLTALAYTTMDMHVEVTVELVSFLAQRGIVFSEAGTEVDKLWEKMIRKFTHVLKFQQSERHSVKRQWTHEGGGLYWQLAGSGIRGQRDLMASVDSDASGGMCFEEFFAVFRSLFRYHAPGTPPKPDSSAQAP